MKKNLISLQIFKLKYQQKIKLLNNLMNFFEGENKKKQIEKKAPQELFPDANDHYYKFLK